MEKLLVATARFDVAGAAVVVIKLRGCTVARTGAGVFRVTLDRAVDDADCLPSVQASGNTAMFINTLNVSDTVKQIATFDEVGAATDPISVVAEYSIVYGGGTGS